MHMLPEGHPVVIESDDIDQTPAHFPDWRIEAIQLGHGKMRASGVQGSFDAVRITGCRFGRSLLLRGTSPRGYASLITTLTGSPRARVNARPIDSRTCLMFGSEAPVDIYLPEHCGLCVVSWQLTAAGNRAASGEKDQNPDRGRATLHALAPDHILLLGRCVDSMEAYRRAGCSATEAARTLKLLHELLSPAIASLFGDPAPLQPESNTTAIRRRAVSLACAYIDAHLREPLALPNLCEAAGVRARTLEYGFRESYDVGPMAYVRSVRLCRVHRELTNAKPVGGSVQNAARRWHFTHIGQFSQDYRILFGERPSMTLDRSRRRRSSDAVLREGALIARCHG
jgi:AraC-like DNA-binding protein